MAEADVFFMEKALAQAAKARGFTSPNPLVGALVVKNGKIIGSGFHKKAGLLHAEAIALQRAGKKAKGADLYVSLEPCCHWGRTPPCVDKIIASGIKRVIIATSDPNPLVKGKSIRKLKACGIEVKTGVLKKEAEKLNEAFFKVMKKRLPFVALKFAQSLDGRITYQGKDSFWITSSFARSRARTLRSFYDGVLVGINTVLADNPRLDSNLRNKEMVKIILDPHLKIKENLRLFKKGKVIIVHNQKKAPLRWQKMKADFLFCPLKGKSFNLKYLLKELLKRGITSLFVEGGAFTLGSFLKAKLADKVYIFVANKIIGAKGLASIGASLNSRFVKVKELACAPLGKELFISGYLRYE